MRKLLSIIAMAWLCGGAGCFGGSFTTDFSDPRQPGFTVSGNAVIQNGELVVTPQVGGGGSFVLDDLDAGAAIESFVAKFQLKFGPSSIVPADGLSFCFGPDISSGSS